MDGSPDDISNLKYLLEPESVAVIGASRDPQKIGYQVLWNLIGGGFPREKIFPINPKAEEILDLKCYPSILEVPEKVDLAVIVVPAKIVPMVLKQCVEKGVKAVAIISAGFGEVGNIAAEEEIVRIAREGGMRLLGPNIVGVANTHNNMNASFCQALPFKGNIAFITQSGALAIALVGWTLLEKIGLSALVSLGNKADVDDADLILYLRDDPKTSVITIYMEGLDDGRKFMDAASKVSAQKPIIIVKAGRSERGAKAASSHTGSLAGSDIAYTAAFKKYGVLRASNIQELFDWAMATAYMPPLKNNNVVILTNGGGAGVLATDECESSGINLMDIPPELAEELRKYMPPFGSVGNPIDLTGMATKEWYKGALKALLSHKDVGGVIVLYCHTAITAPMEIAEAIIEAYEESNKDKPITTSFIGGSECLKSQEHLRRNNIPSYPSPERAVSAMAALLERGKYLMKPPSKAPKLDVDRVTAQRIIGKALEEDRSALSSIEAFQVAEAYGIPVPPLQVVKSREEAVSVARSVGFPLVAEIESPDIIHKTDVGGIVLNIENEDAALKAFDQILENIKKNTPTAKVIGVAFRKMVEEGQEVLVGMHRDPTFGPLIAFGMGGIFVNILKDVSFRITPLAEMEAKEMISETKASKILYGYRGMETLDINSVVDVILRVSQLAMDFKEITDIDVNPLFVYRNGCVAVDVKILLGKSEKNENKP